MEERVLVSFRTATDSRSAFVTEAKSQGVSVNQLLDDALNQYFDPEWNPDKVFASRSLFGKMKLVAAAMQAAGAAALHLDTGSPINEREWFKDPYAYDQAMHAALTVLEAYRPPGKRDPSHPSIDTAANEFKLRVGEVLAGDLLAEVAGSEAAGSPGEKLRRYLDPSVVDNIKKTTGGKK